MAKVSRSDFTIIRPLAEAKNGGCNAGIYLVRGLSGTKYIEKRVDTDAIRKLYANREIEALIRLNGFPNIIRLRGYNIDYSRTGYGSIYMQHCELGSLDNLIKRFATRDARLSDEGFLWKVLWDASLALCHMFSGVSQRDIIARINDGKDIRPNKGWNGTLHRDLKPGNICLTRMTESDLYPIAVLVDFGCCTSFEDIASGLAGAARHSGNTPAFEPPESPAFCQRSDGYSLGLTIHCLARMSNHPDIKRYGTLSYRHEDDRLRELLRNCTHSNHSKRPTPGELPRLVAKGYWKWKSGRKNDGERLPWWAFE
ncbi:kinase-like domain-containing protein [Paraphoma chrysanthemicola]|uniref:non-specific serine/threonine protein kinase n=1 Tax=Paraphoma chrysanthemicola TaxID=798071 RepID=A0A8K0VZN2_9PLEO|nr:kinase-like domain-containing protein [Paraphoma chrysanthemicola]